jgi:hypothetical protein
MSDRCASGSWPADRLIGERMFLRIGDLIPMSGQHMQMRLGKGGPMNVTAELVLGESERLRIRCTFCEPLLLWQRESQVRTNDYRSLG